MGQKLPPKEMALYRRCDEILHYLWDPIGVRGAAGARDEYEGYLPQVFALVMADQPDPNAIADHLVAIESDRMSLSPRRTKAEEIAGTLLAAKKWIFENGP
jgi:hypothetical protein